MRKQGIFAAMVIAAVLVFSLAPKLRARAQTSTVTTTVTLGSTFTLTADGGAYMSIPNCSVAAGCLAQMEICNTDAKGAADSAHCITIAAAGQKPWNSNLWTGILETTTTATGSSSTPYGFGYLRVNVPNPMVKITP
jgi:hypothetical protein